MYQRGITAQLHNSVCKKREYKNYIYIKPKHTLKAIPHMFANIYAYTYSWDTHEQTKLKIFFSFLWFPCQWKELGYLQTSSHILFVFHTWVKPSKISFPVKQNELDLNKMTPPKNTHTHIHLSCMDPILFSH